MAKVWDDSMKRLMSANPQHFVSWVLKGAQYKRSLSTELRNKVREADFLVEATFNGEEISIHFEFQSSDDEDMAERLLEYNVDATLEHKRRVLSCVIYLRKDSNIVESPLEWKLPDGHVLLWFEFVVIKLWEIAAEELMSTGLV
ncbi:MAG: hypothetical protein JOZ18_02680, partial [Chloroflexi bacterium]|nr:hypothetical protein [Chloroflexota bacterium]